MNEAKALLDAGNLGGAVEAAIQSVKSKPTDIQARTFLFELSLFSGDWERANRQLDAIGHQSVEAMIGSKIYQQCIEAEGKRAKFFSESLKPEFLSTPPDYVYGLLTANNRLREGKTAEAREILDTVEEQRPAFACQLNGEEKQDFRDYNDLTSSILEVIIKDSYVWIPFEDIVKIEFTKPQSLRDLFWLQANLETLSGTNGEVFIPTLYVDSWKHASDQVRLGRMTDWREAGSELYIGEGQKLFFIDGEDRPILELNKVEFSREEMAESA
ncbi:MAG TPA: type VI secretion system accessory protein TagJ [Pyrinomonadaceae bacterium]|jgi:type VI secretion system protein ImpE